MQKESTTLSRDNALNTKKRVYTRDSNIELLRIICMFFIVVHHFSCHSSFYFEPTDLCLNNFLINFLYSGGKIGVDVFVLITGFFMYKSDVIKFDRIFKLWLQLFTINMIIFIICVSTGYLEFSWLELLHYILPVTFEKAWFASAYFVLVLLIPGLNAMIKNLTQKRHLILIIIGLILWCIIPTFIFDKTYFYSDWEFNSIIWFIFLYVVGAYLAKYGLTKKQHNASFYLVISTLIYLVTLSLTYLFIYLGRNNEYFYKHITGLFQMQTLPVLAISVLLLVGFSKIKIKPNKYINFISSTTFGIYLIHDNEIMRNFIWVDLFKDYQYQNSPYLFLIAIGLSCTVFIVCSLLETLRQYSVELIYKKPIKRLSNFIDIKMKESMPDKKELHD